MEISKIINSNDFLDTFKTFNIKHFGEHNFPKYQYVLTDLTIREYDINHIDIYIQGDKNSYSDFYLNMACNVIKNYNIYNDKVLQHLKDVINVNSFENIVLLGFFFGDFVSSGFIKQGFTVSISYNPFPLDIYQTLIYNIHFELKSNGIFWLVGNSLEFMF
ncbi:MAG: hypothetical protein ACI4WH_03530 [Oscillospiraceae bacterium]